MTSPEPYVIDVIPIARGIFKDTLSYFSTEKPEIGSLLAIPLRGKSVTGLVTAVALVRERKEALKRGSFALKRIQKLKSAPYLSPEFLSAAERTADYYAGTLGAVLNTLLPKEIPAKDATRITSVSPTPKGRVEKYIVQGRLPDRVSEYKTIIREHFARGVSVFLLFPTVKEAEVLVEELSRGIGRYSYVLHGLLQKKTLRERWQAVLKEEHPVLIMATGNFLSIPRRDIGCYIVEKEQSRFYRSSVRPYIDVRRFTEYLSEARGTALIYGDTSLRVETAKRHVDGELELRAASKFRLLGSAQTTVVDLRTKEEAPGTAKQKTWKVLSDELEGILAEAAGHHERSFLYTARRGLSPLVLCNDCETVVTCKHCEAPVVLHGTGREPSFLCHRCGEKRSAEERCAECGGWKLVGLGVGSETVARAIHAQLPETPIFILDRDHAINEKKAKEIAEKFYETPGSILLGTEMALFYLTKPVENVAAVAFDSLFAVPDFRMQERIFHLLLELRERAASRFLIQSRVEPGKLFEHVAQGNLDNFYKDDLAMREKLHYPPYRTHIRLTLSGERSKITGAMQTLTEAFAQWKPLSFPALFKNTRGEYAFHLLLSLSPGTWPTRELLEKLRALPPRVRVEVDPESSG